MTDNCSYGSLVGKCLKMKIFLLIKIVFYFLHKENPAFLRQKPRKLPSVEANSEGCADMYIP